MELEPMEPLKPGESPVPGGIRPGPDTSHRPVTANNDAALVRDARGSSMNDLEQRKDETTDQYIDRLRAAAERADEAEGWIRESRKAVRLATRRAEQAEAALLAAQQEHDALREQHVSLNEWYQQLTEDWKERGARAERAEATITRLREAIEYALTYDLSENTGYYDVGSVLRAAINPLHSLVQDAEQENASG